MAPHDEGKDKYAGKNGDCRADNDRRDDGDEDEGKDLAKGRYREVGDPKTNASAVAIIGVGSSSAIAGAATAGAVVVMLLRWWPLRRLSDSQPEVASSHRTSYEH